MSEKRWVSHGLVDMLIEMRKYDTAAEVVSGSGSVFSLLSNKIGSAIERAEDGANDSDLLELKNLLEEAKEEIWDHQDWQQEVFEKLADQADDYQELTVALRQAFDDSSAARTKLLDEVMLSGERFNKAQEKAFVLEL